MAEEMRSDSMEYIQDYLATQLMVSQSTGKPTVRTRRAEAQERVGESVLYLVTVSVMNIVNDIICLGFTLCSHQADEDSAHKKGSRKPSSEETSHTAAKRKKL